MIRTKLAHHGHAWAKQQAQCKILNGTVYDQETVHRQCQHQEILILFWAIVPLDITGAMNSISFTYISPYGMKTFRILRYAAFYPYSHSCALAIESLNPGESKTLKVVVWLKLKEAYKCFYVP